MLQTIKTYYALTKPGIIYGNIFTAAAGFLFAAQWRIDTWLFIATIGGMTLLIAAACVTNNYLDRVIDAKMTRTKRRALVTKTISLRSALLFAGLLYAVGFGLLGIGSTKTVLVIGAVAVVDYVVLYGIAKRRSVYGTLVGSVAGAAPIVAGYVAARGQFDSAAWLLFAVLTCWQMPHFYGIALYRLKDYQLASIPVLPAIAGTSKTKLHILAWIVLFGLAVCGLAITGNTGWSFTILIAGLTLFWLLKSYYQFSRQSAEIWGRQVFLSSLLILGLFAILLPFSTILP